MSDKLFGSMRILRDVTYRARLEERRIRKAKVEFVTLSILVAALLGVDYTAAEIIFTYLDPTLGSVSLGPQFLAICVPIAVVAFHLLASEDEGKSIEYRLKRLAVPGVFVFLLGIASMLSLVYLDAADGVGAQSSSSAIQGTLGSAQLGDKNISSPWLFEMFRAVFSNLSPIIFFAGMALILFVTVYASHRLLLKIEERYEFFSGASRRARELKQIFRQVEGLALDIRRVEARIGLAKKKLPRDPQHRFAQIASAAIHDALHQMKFSLRGLDHSDAGDWGLFPRRAPLPPDITSRAEGMTLIADIRHATTPYAILKNLGELPPKEEDE